MCNIEQEQATEDVVTPFHNEAVEYLKQHKIPELFEILTSSLVYNQPHDPKNYIQSYLKQLQESRKENNSDKLPKFFDESNVTSIFGMLDVSGKGHITLDQYKQAMVTMGIPDYNNQPAGSELNKINEETFLRESCSGLQKLYQTYF